MKAKKNFCERKKSEITDLELMQRFLPIECEFHSLFALSAALSTALSVYLLPLQW